ncbi:hypothetical protein [Mycoplasmopsis lipofaciens]|uniref:hypothetical protein n=1 Tax=Mycoplasmopsis lipofaciens TaxID=114884 RepID=UPI0004836CD3|nr:hypothetical protein [Mycoplasmopsis lipofaciens]
MNKKSQLLNKISDSDLNLEMISYYMELNTVETYNELIKYINNNKTSNNKYRKIFEFLEHENNLTIDNYIKFLCLLIKNESKLQNSNILETQKIIKSKLLQVKTKKEFQKIDASILITISSEINSILFKLMERKENKSLSLEHCLNFLTNYKDSNIISTFRKYNSEYSLSKEFKTNINKFIKNKKTKYEEKLKEIFLLLEDENISESKKNFLMVLDEIWNGHCFDNLLSNFRNLVTNYFDSNAKPNIKALIKQIQNKIKNVKKKKDK